MRNSLVVAVILVLVAAGGGAGYYFGAQQSNTANIGSCSPLPAQDGASATIAGFHVTVSYDGSWRLTVATFASKVIDANALFSTCIYEGSGTMTFYVGAANYSGWSTLVALGHKFGSNGTLTVTANLGNVTGSNSTTQSYGSATTTISFDFA